MHFPDFESLKRGANFRKFRQPRENETEVEFREAFADHMVSIDRVESAEIRMGGNGKSFYGLKAMDKLIALQIIPSKQ
jgi:hypothetical protein